MGVYGSECGLLAGPACVLLDCAAWECPPSWGCVTDTSEKESPLIILRLEGRGPISYPGLGTVFGSEVTTVAPDGILMQGPSFPTPKRPPEVAVVVVWFQNCRVDPYSSAKITKNRARLGNRPDWAVFRSNVTTVAPDGNLMQGQRLPIPN
ncbi:hypothetical protein CRG98_014738 [Punica granatum]|uniref:Uncharacterized protein n=1 Tax=Punica granatum TaxID=22663 RepID=A0A2I0K8K6_PUNGR|nr:hypothetical protein CRG98_014738 [Punica granatum]